MSPSDRQFDLAIVGGGPAGTSAAITAARSGAKVALFESRSFPRHKVCGEFVSAEALDILRGLLTGMPASNSLLADAPVLDRTRLFFGQRMIDAPISPSALSIPRYDLDDRLWAAGQAAGVKAFAECEVAATGGNGPFELRTSQGDFAAKALIVAAGRWSAFTADRSLPSGPRWIGVKAHFAETNPSPSSDLYFFEGGYCGVQPIGKDLVNACAMVRSDRATTLSEVFRQHPRLGMRAMRWTAVMPAVSTAPLIYRKPEPVRHNIFFVGDAAAFIDPFVGDGISIALRSGRVAAQAVFRFLSGEVSLSRAAVAYEEEYYRQFTPLLAAAARMRALFLLPQLAKVAVFEMLRLPGLMPLVIRKTRRAA